jgi:hypothetical protein
MTRSALLLLPLSAFVFAPAPLAAEVLDAGTYEVYQGDRALGVETFGFERLSDSLYIYSSVTQKFPGPSGEITLEKTMRLLINEFDGGLILYESIQTLNGEKLVRAIIPSDTSMTVYREGDVVGEGTTIVRPPGKIYIVDPQVFALFDLLCREMSGRTFEQRPVQLFVLAAQDTTVAAVVTDQGVETIRWGAKPVQARKLRISDESSEFIAMVGPRGDMLQLLQPASGLRVVRRAPDVKPPGSR